MCHVIYILFGSSLLNVKLRRVPYCGICVADFWFQEGLSWIELIKRIGHFQGYHIICHNITWWSSLPLRVNNSCRSVFIIIFWIMWFYHKIFCWETIIILGLTMKAIVFQPQTELSNIAWFSHVFSNPRQVSASSYFHRW